MNTPHTLLQSLQQLLDYHDGRSAEPITLNQAVEHARQTLDFAEIRLRSNFNRILRETLESLDLHVGETIAAIVAGNIEHKAKGEPFCECHEYCDGNAVFDEAFQATYGEEFDPQNDLHQHLYHQGWVITPDEPEKPEAPITAESGWVVQQPDGRKYVVAKPHEIDPGAKVIAARPHGDGDFSYTCGSEYCKCGS